MVSQSSSLTRKHPMNMLPRFTKIIRILKYGRPYWRKLLGIMVLAVLGIVLSLPQPIVLKILIDDVLPTGNLSQLHLLLAALLGLFILQNIVGFGQKYFSSVVGQHVLIDIRQEIFTHLLRLSPKYFHQTQTGDLMSRLLQDASSLKAIAITAPINLFANIIILIVILLIIFQMNWRLALVSSVTVPGFLLTILIFNHPIRQSSTKVREAFSVVNSRLQENLTGIRLIQVFANKVYEEHRFLTQLKHLAKVQIHSDVINSWGGIVGGLVVAFRIGDNILEWKREDRS